MTKKRKVSRKSDSGYSSKRHRTSSHFSLGPPSPELLSNAEFIREQNHQSTSRGMAVGAGYLSGAGGAALATADPASILWGGVIGAGRAYRQLPQRNINMSRRGSNAMSIDTQKEKTTGTGGILRTTQRLKGRNAKKHKEKHVKVSKYLKEAIHQVHQGEVGRGFYKRIFNGGVGVLMGGAAPPALTIADGNSPFNLQQTVILPSFQQPAGTRTLFNSLVDFKPALASAVNQGSDMNFFTIGKVLHAASVLFNGKADNPGPYITTGNLTTQFNNSNGALLPATAGTLKVDVKSSWVKFTIKNLSDRVMLLDMWELGPKIKFEARNALDALASVAANSTDGATLDSEIQYNTILGNRTTGLFQDGTVDPFKLYNRVGLNWSGLHREFTLQPDETCIHFIKGPSGVLDYAKMVSTTGSATGTNIPQVGMLKNWSTSVVIGVRADQAFETSAANLPGRFTYFVPATPGILTNVVAVEFEEVYNLEVPEIAGFVFPAAPAGGTQQALNFRKNKTVITNFISQEGNTAALGNIIVSSEESPALSVPATQTN
nr:MAG: capsid protein [Cressdnaviricota sp.]